MFPEPNTSDVNVDELEESDWILYGEKYRQKKEAKTDVEDTVCLFFVLFYSLI